MVWEAVFMLVLLKIPIVYLCMVVWWAIRAEPRDELPAARVPVSDTPGAAVELDARRAPRTAGRARQDAARARRASPGRRS